jgi:hypothetical protein
MSWNLDDYELVEDRIRKFWADHPDGRITTSLLDRTESRYIVQAHVWRTGAMGDLASASGLAEETVGSTPVNKTSALENCETSAIGRALANLGYAAKGKRPSREEMDKPAREWESKSGEPGIGKYQCPACGSQVYDNRVENKDTKFPLWACSNKKCEGGGKRKGGSGNYPWGSYEEDPGDAGLIGPAPVRTDYGAAEVPLPEALEEYGPEDAPF